MAEQEHKALVLSARTLIPAGAFLVLASSLFYAGTQVSMWEQRLGAVENSVNELRIEAKDNRWTRDDARNWTDALKLLNPTLTVPVIR